MRRAGLVGLVLLVLGVVYVAAWRTQPAASQPAALPSGPRDATVTSVTRSCPPPGPGTGTAHVSVISIPAQAKSAKAAQPPAGSAVLNAVPAAAATTAPAAPRKKHPTPTSSATAKPTATSSTTAKPKKTSKPAAESTRPAQPVTLPGPGTPATVAVPGADSHGGTAVTATGLMAEGFEAEQATASGMGTVSCAHPGSDMWYVGTGAGAGAPQIRLYLTNTGDLAASVNVGMITDAGVQPGLGSAITVQPHQFVSQDIAPFVHGSQALALHVQTSSGQVAASVWEGSGSSGTWLPQASAPSTTLVIPGLTSASSAARLFVMVPGAIDARVKVVAFTAQGKFPQFGSSPVDAPAVAASSFPLTSLGASAAGLELISNVPITAGVIVPGSGIGSFTAGVAPITEQGVVAGNPTTKGVTVGLVLTAPAGSVQANITVIPSGAAASAGIRQPVTVQAGHTVAVTVPRPPGGREPFAIVITPLAGSGPLYAARVVTSGTGGLSAPVVSLLPVPSALTAITLPSAQNTYSAILPGAGG
jgi:Family of unknown function (DUF5719)